MRRAVTRLLPLSLLTACATNLVGLPASELTPKPRPRAVWVTRTDGFTIRLDRARSEHDSIFGYRDGFPLAMSLADVQSLQTERGGTSTTTQILVAVGVVIGSVVAIAIAPHDF
jgi:hypothetical protein